MSTATHRRIGRRNKFPTPCAECGKTAPPETGELLAKAEGERWKCLCDDCLARHRAQRSAQAEYHRAKFDEALRRERQRREQAYEWLKAEQAMEDLLRNAWRATSGASGGARSGSWGGSAYEPPPCLVVLGLDLPTDADQIKRAYREKSKQAHPDAGGSASEFIKLKNAYDSALRLVGAAR